MIRAFICWGCLLPAVLNVCIEGNCQIEVTTQIPHSIADLEFAFSCNPTSTISGWLLDRYFDESSLSDLDQATLSDCSTIAFAAEWRKLGLSKTISDLAKAELFVQFFQGRSRLIVPKQWANSLGGDRITKIEEASFKFPTSSFDSVLGEERTDIIVKDSKLLFVVGNEKFSVLSESELNPKILKEEKYNRFKILDSGDYWIVVFFNDDALPGLITCVDKIRQRIKWQQESWGKGAGILESFTGPPRIYQQYFAVEGNRVVIFGTGCCVFSEVFDLETGSVVFRFSDQSWNWRKTIRLAYQIETFMKKSNSKKKETAH